MQAGPPHVDRARPLPWRVACAVLAALALAACDDEPILPGERIPVRPDEAPAALAAGAAIPGISLPAPRVNAEWTHVNGTAEGRITHPALATVPQPRWQVDIGEGGGRRSRLIVGPIAAGGLIFAVDANAQLSAVTPAGAVAWTTSLVPPGQQPDSGPGGGMAYAGGVLFVTTGFGEVMALDPSTGGIYWREMLDAPVRAAPVVSGGQVYVVARDDTAYGLDAQSGEFLWRDAGAVGGAGLLGGASPATDGQILMVPYSSGELLALLSRNGIQLWGTAVTGGRRELVRNRIGDITGDPVIDGGTVYASNQSGRTVSVDLRTGVRNWTISEGAFGPAWPTGGSLFLLSDQGELVRIAAGSGEVLWSVQLPQYENPERRRSAIPHYGPILAGGRLWVASGDGLLRAFAPGNGRQVASLPLPGGAAAAPIVAGGVMYVVTRDGTLHAFQ